MDSHHYPPLVNRRGHCSEGITYKEDADAQPTTPPPHHPTAAEGATGATGTGKLAAAAAEAGYSAGYIAGGTDAADSKPTATRIQTNTT